MITSPRMITDRRLSVPPLWGKRLYRLCVAHAMHEAALLTNRPLLRAWDHDVFHPRTYQIARAGLAQPWTGMCGRSAMGLEGRGTEWERRTVGC
jgi:hypothetical protein